MYGRTPDFQIQITATSTDHFTEAFPAPDVVLLPGLVASKQRNGAPKSGRAAPQRGTVAPNDVPATPNQPRVI